MALNPYKNYRTLRRYQQILMIVGRYGFGQLLRRLRPLGRLKWRVAEEDAEKVRATRAVRFRMMLEQLGPTFIKIGQILSTRPDLLPSDVIAELTNLQDHVTPTPWDAVRKFLTRKDNVDPIKCFAEFDTEPIASASVAQVYVAKLHSGEKVAVKIIRPGTAKIFHDDLNILEHLAHLAQTHLEEARRWNPLVLVEQLRSSVSRELDLLREARNADIFRGHFADDSTVYVPKIYWECCSDHMLVMEYVEGTPLSNYFGADASVSDRKDLARKGANAVLKQVFYHGFFQADPHPGNALVLPGNVICFLDFGMFGRLDEQALNVLTRVLRAIVKKDIGRLLKAARDLDVLPDDVNLTELRIAVLDLIEQYHGLPLKQISVSKVLRDIVRLVSRFNLQVRHDFLFLIKALSTVEATGRELDPDFDMVSHVEPFVHKLVLQSYSPRQLANRAQRVAEDVAQLAQETPEHLLEIMRKLRNGRINLDLHHRGLEHPLARLNQMLDKVVLGLVIAALIIAAAILGHAKIGPTYLGYPIIGGVAFVIAAVSGLWLVFDILRSRKK
ncbi:MAG: hypothetical protein JW936_00425 [Sedimentisphaerales bacterium]|nr:hypothetical protein [Sedimentisphaerales bacterium]